MSSATRVAIVLATAALSVLLATVPIGGTSAGEKPAVGDRAPSRAAGWLDQDRVEPIADLINTSEPGGRPRFVDRIGAFQVTLQGRALEITGSFPSATVWRFDLTTFDQQFDMRRLYVAYGKCAFADPKSIWSRRLTRPKPCSPNSRSAVSRSRSRVSFLSSLATATSLGPGSKHSFQSNAWSIPSKTIVSSDC